MTVHTRLRSKADLQTVTTRKRYLHLFEHFRSEDRLSGIPLGEKLMAMKNEGNQDYRLFLNEYGDLVYSDFKLVGTGAEQKGVYVFTVNDRPVYVGRCRDSFKRRVNAGYGRISPKNCFLDGQRTNCRINAAITEARRSGEVKFWVCPISDNREIMEAETNIFMALRDAHEMEKTSIWNIVRPQSPLALGDPSLLSR